MSNPDISIIVPVYNIEKYLAPCLDSLAAQGGGSYEVLLVNDGSTDKSQQICEQYEKKDSRFRLINKPNGGCATARNRGIEEARGTYVGFVDSDDWVSDEMYSLLLKDGLKNGSDIVQCGFVKYFEHTDSYETPDEKWLFEKYKDAGKATLAESQAMLYLQPTIWRRIYRRTFLQKHSLDFPVLPRYDDLPFQFKTFALAETVSLVDHPGYFYRLDRPEQDVGANDEKLYVHFDIFSDLDDFVQNRDDLEGALFRIKLSTHNWAMSKIVNKLKVPYLQRAKKDLAGSISRMNKKGLEINQNDLAEYKRNYSSVIRRILRKLYSIVKV